MPNNELNHNRTLSNLNTNAKYAKNGRRWSRYGRNGETYTCSAWSDARKAYNKAHRRASKLQLSRYQEHAFAQQELDAEYYTWEDLRTQEDEWYEQDMAWTISTHERRFNSNVQRNIEESYVDEAVRNWNDAYNRLGGRFPY